MLEHSTSHLYPTNRGRRKLPLELVHQDARPKPETLWKQTLSIPTEYRMPGPVDFSTTGMEHPRRLSIVERSHLQLPTRVSRHIGTKQQTPFNPLGPQGTYLALSSQYSYSTMCDRRTPADESQCFLAEPVWSASDHDACFREDDWRYPPIFHSEKVNRVWGPKGERTADSHPAVCWRRLSSVTMRRGVLSSYLRHIDEWTESRHIAVGWRAGRMRLHDPQPGTTPFLLEHAARTVPAYSSTMANSAASWRARGHSIVLFQKGERWPSAAEIPTRSI